MRISDIFTKLSYGELASLDIGNEGAGTIEPEIHARVLTHIVAALDELYSRYVLKRSYVRILTSSAIESYTLEPEHSVLDDSAEVPKYIHDVPPAERFTGDIVKIISVTREDDPATQENEKQPYGINARNAKPAVRITSYNTFWLENPPEEAYFRVEFQATHPPLTVEDIPSQRVFLPPILREALLLRVAAGIYSSMAGEAHVAKSQELFMRFEKACQLVDLKDLSQESSHDEMDKVRDKGFY